MLKLIIKDFSIQKKTIKRYLISALFLSVFFWFTDMRQMAFSMAMFPLIYGFMNGALYEDEKSNTLRLLASLPIKKEIIVYARYTSVALVTVGSAIIFMILNCFVLVKLLPPGDNSLDGSIFVIITVLLVFMVLVSFYLPMAFKMGYIKAAGINRFVMLGLFGAFTALISVLGGLKKDGTVPDEMTKVLELLEKSGPVAVIGIFGLIVLLAYLASMKLSVKFFKSRNLF
ncbi:MAG: ABC-2 transporter permease [Clostridia bacterium]|nr:ABC-2 transporter permease [Clostridia bacterium]